MANQENDQQPIIVKKVGKKHKPHSSAWKVAYADFVTAMMAFFIVMWVLAQSESVKGAMAAYFKDPTGQTNKQGQALMNTPSQNIKPIMRQQIAKANKERLKMLKDEMVKELKKNEEFKDMIDQTELSFNKEGLIIEILHSDIHFQVGSAVLKPESVKFIKFIGSSLAQIPNHISIEGHTDSRPYTYKKNYDNFSLSSDRANSARYALMSGGLPLNQIDEIRGMADKKLRNSKDPYDSVNRRVTIIVKYDKSEGIDSLKTDLAGAHSKDIEVRNSNE